jgi:hypothetical protein
VLGTCPRCGSAAARGDQCDDCGNLLDPTDLIRPRSALSGDSALELRDSRHLFLRQPLLLERLNAWVAGRSGWPSFVVSLAKSWLTSDLRDRCITRDLAWGVAVPRPGFESKVFYVWFDAPIAYIAATQDWADRHRPRDWRDWWWQADDVRYVQFLGKDNVPFHAVSFPATLLGSGEPWKTVDVIKGFHWLTYRGRQILHQPPARHLHRCGARRTARRSLALVADRQRPRDVGHRFHVARFAADVNKDLADVFGNLVNRLVPFRRAGLRRSGAERRRAREREQALAAEICAASRGCGASRSARLPACGRRNPRHLGARQRLSAAERALELRSGAVRRDHADRIEFGAPVGCAGVEHRAEPFRESAGGVGRSDAHSALAGTTGARSLGRSPRRPADRRHRPLVAKLAARRHRPPVRSLWWQALRRSAQVRLFRPTAFGTAGSPCPTTS